MAGVFPRSFAARSEQSKERARVVLNQLGMYPLPEDQPGRRDFEYDTYATHAVFPPGGDDPGTRPGSVPGLPRADRPERTEIRHGLTPAKYRHLTTIHGPGPAGLLVECPAPALLPLARLAVAHSYCHTDADTRTGTKGLSRCPIAWTHCWRLNLASALGLVGQGRDRSLDTLERLA